MGGFLARMGLIQNAALDHVNLFWSFPIYANSAMEYWNYGIMIRTKDFLLCKINIRVSQYSNIPLFHFSFLYYSTADSLNFGKQNNLGQRFSEIPPTPL